MPDVSVASLRQRHTRQWLLFSLILSASALALVYDVYADKIQTERASEERMRAQLHVVDANLEAQLRSADAALKDIISDIAITPIVDAQRRLRALSDAMPGIRSIAVLDAQGRARITNHADFVGRDFSAREYFQRARSDGQLDRLYVSPPFTGATGAFVITLTRIIPDRNGRFNGVLVASLDKTYFTTLLQSVLYAPDMWAGMAHDQGKLFLFVPEREGMPGKDLSAPGSSFAKHVEGGSVESMQYGKAAATGEERWLAMRTIKPTGMNMDHGLVVSLARAPESVLTTWRHASLTMAGVFTSFWLLTGFLLRAYQRRQHHLELIEQRTAAALRQSSERLRLATQIAALGVWEYDLSREYLTWDEGTMVMYGTDRHRFTHRLSEWSERVLPEDREQAQAALRLAIESKGVLSTRFRIHRDDGETRVIRALGHVFCDETNTPLRIIGINEDITERESAREALREAEERFRSAFNDAAIGMAMVNLNGNFIAANQALIEMLGYAPEEMAQLRFQEITYADDLTAELALLQEVLNHKRNSFQVEKRYVKKTGDIIWGQLTVSVIRTPDGAPRYFISQVQDITARKEANERIRHERDLFAGGPAMVFLWEIGDTWPITHASGNTTAIIGFSPEEITAPGFNFVEHIHPDDVETCTQAMSAFIASTENTLELTYRFRLKDRSYRWFYDYNTIERNSEGIPVRMRCYMLDQSTQRQTENALRETSLLLSSVLDAATETALIASTPQGLITVFNPGAERMLGYRADEMVGRQTPVIIHLQSEVEARAKQLSSELGYPVSGFEAFVIRAQHSGSEQRDWTYVRKDGTQLTVSLTVTCMRDDNDEITGYLGIARDVTARRAYEAALIEAKLEAELASHAKSQFLANMSHEIRTPLNATLGMLQLLQASPLEPTQRDYANKASSAAQSLLSILNDILDFSKIEAGKLELECQPFSSEQLLRNLAVILSANGANKPVEILFDADPALPEMLIGDPLRLQQVLINLGGNAIKFTQSGEVVIRLRVVEDNAAGVNVEFSVRDTGIGIPAEQLQRIFESFSQAEASTSRRFGGTGLGLTICQRLVSLMGGSLSVESQLGVGTTFRFTLSFARLEMPVSLPHTDGLKVLIVDDNALARSTLEVMGTSLGWQCHSVASGNDAVNLLADDAAPAFDLILMDWQMPGIDGWQASERIRALAHVQPQPRIIMVSAHSHALFDQRSQGAPGLLDGYLLKPFTASMLAETVAVSAAGQQQPSVRQRNRLQGLRVLIIEDNSLNQQVILGLLESEGATAEVAADASAGIRRCLNATPAFDAVLMDIQMPDMDGYSAARILRRDLPNLPILALTANVMESDKAACLAAGMNAHIGKPVDLDVLVRTLCELCRTAQHGLPTFEAVLDPEAAIARMGGNRVLYRRMAHTFCADAPLLLDAITAAKDDLPTLSATLHTLKGNAATVGANRLTSLLKQAEGLLRDKTPLPPELLATIQYVFNQSCSELQLMATEHLQNEGLSPESPDATTLLNELATLLDARNMRALDILTHLRHHAVVLNEPHGSALLTALDELDFKTALMHCQALQQEFS